MSPRGVPGSGPAKGGRGVTASNAALTSAAPRIVEIGPKCPIDGAPLVGGQCAACEWRARKYAPVLAAGSGICECGAPTGGGRIKRCPPCKKLHGRAMARGITLPAVSRTAAPAPTSLASSKTVVETPLRTCDGCEKKTRQDPCGHCGTRWKRA
jgi:hypothetical protein